MATVTTVTLGADDITNEVYSVSIRRGRSRESDEFSPTTGQIRLRNYTRDFDPEFFVTNTFLLLESGDYVLLETGDKILLEQGDAASGAYGVISLGRDIEVKDGAVTVFSGHLEDTSNSYDVNGRTDASLQVGDVLTSMANTDLLSDWESTENQLAGARLTELLGLSDVGLSSFVASFDDGTVPLQGTTVAAGTNVLQYAQTVSRTEWGKFYVKRDGFLDFRDRYTFPSQTAVADFDDTGTNFEFNGLGVNVGSELRAWSAVVTRVGGEPKTATASTSPPGSFGRRGVSFSGLLFRDDEESKSLAEFVAEKYSSTEAVVSALRVVLSGLSTADRATIAAIDINDAVTLSWTPTGAGETITQSLVVEGVEYEADMTGFAAMTFQLSAFPDTTYFVLDTDTLDGGVPLGF